MWVDVVVGERLFWEKESYTHSIMAVFKADCDLPS